jgi:cytochrome d ubiquinol oxidase subunit II
VALARGFEIEEQSFAGSMFDWLTPFSLLTGIALVSGYALLGATWRPSRSSRR